MSLRHGLLGLLADGPASGYDLLRRFDNSLVNVWPASQSQLSPELNKLARDGRVEVVEEGGRHRKTYGITEAGRAELRHWLVEVPPVRAPRSEALLRVFFLRTLDPDEARGYLRKEAAAYRGWLDHLEQLRDELPWSDSGFDRFGRIALESGIRTAAALIEWAEWAEHETEHRPAGP
jgi:DNA-binding PadR family transcriptional regulator